MLLRVTCDCCVKHAVNLMLVVSRVGLTGSYNAVHIRKQKLAINKLKIPITI